MVTESSICELIVYLWGELHWLLDRYESVTWFPNAVSFIAMLGVGGKYLNPATMPTFPTPTPSVVISFACFLGSSVMSWCTLTPDYGVYHNVEASTLVFLSWQIIQTLKTCSRFRIFIYTYLGSFCSGVCGLVLSIRSWFWRSIVGVAAHVRSRICYHS